MIRKSSFIYILSFFIGIFFVNLIGSDYLISHGIISFWSHSDVVFQPISYDHYFFYIVLERMKIMVLILLLSCIFSRKIVMQSGICILMLFWGAFMAMAVAERGWYGVIAAIGAVVPQWIFYLCAFSIYGNKRTGKAGIAAAVLLAALGCLAESYLSPFLLKKIL